MSENSLKVLSIIAVIIGASGLGFGAYSLMQVQSGAVKGDEGDDGGDGSDGADGTIIRIDSKISYAAAYSSPVDEYLPINSLNITFNIFSGESAHFLYTGQAETYSNTYISVAFMLDGKLVPNIVAYFSNPAAGGFQYSRSSLSMQFSNTTLSVGSHEITIVRIGSESINYVGPNVLYVQIYRS